MTTTTVITGYVAEAASAETSRAWRPFEITIAGIKTYTECWTELNALIGLPNWYLRDDIQIIYKAEV